MASVREPSVRERIRGDLRRAIQSGQYAPGAKLPRSRDLMAQYGTPSASLVAAALRDLVDEGLVTARQGAGYYVRVRQALRRDLVADLRREAALAHGAEPAGSLVGAVTGAQDVTVRTVYRWREAPARVAEALELPPGSRAVLEREFLFRLGGAPHQLVTSWMPALLARSLGLLDVTAERPGAGTLAHLIAAGIRVAYADQGIETRMPMREEARRMGLTPGTPVFDNWRVLYNPDGRRLELLTAVVPGDRVSYVTRTHLEGGR